MPIIERDVILQGINEHGDQTIDMPITRLGNIEDTADIKNVPGKTDYIPVIDIADNGQMKKTLVSELEKEVGKSSRPRSIGIVLSTSGWTGSAAPYTQTVSVAGVQADEAGQLVQVAPASASRSAWREAGVECTAQGAGKLTFQAGEKPGGNISVFVILQEVQG